MFAVCKLADTVDASPTACLSPSDFQKLCRPCRHYRRKSLRPLNTYSNFIKARLLDLVNQYRQHRFIGNNNQDFLHLRNITDSSVDSTKAYHVLQTGYFYLLQIRAGEVVISSRPVFTHTMERELRSILLPFRKLLCALTRKTNINTSLSATTLNGNCLKMERNMAKFSAAAVRILLQTHSFLDNNCL